MFFYITILKFSGKHLPVSTKNVGWLKIPFSFKWGKLKKKLHSILMKTKMPDFYNGICKQIWLNGQTKTRLKMSVSKGA